jgi:hypothetical protein
LILPSFTSDVKPSAGFLLRAQSIIVCFSPLFGIHPV